MDLISAFFPETWVLLVISLMLLYWVFGNMMQNAIKSMEKYGDFQGLRSLGSQRWSPGPLLETYGALTDTFLACSPPGDQVAAEIPPGFLWSPGTGHCEVAAGLCGTPSLARTWTSATSSFSIRGHTVPCGLEE
ncbi:uncharacterized protein LOC132650979 isoform X6 [Meriones unguiculatus]|uniref:uncharacterized protein LOC132650979 isoform X6 n=1 Tax=Meriones unguiculatus TaxID=10047 RepID=UPI00293E10B0|nr:uncharacterized protein LOC132650979 isoform X6 [Meriones unguiculatus]